MLLTLKDVLTASSVQTTSKRGLTNLTQFCFNRYKIFSGPRSTSTGARKQRCGSQTGVFRSLQPGREHPPPLQAVGLWFCTTWRSVSGQPPLKSSAPSVLSLTTRCKKPKRTSHASEQRPQRRLTGSIASIKQSLKCRVIWGRNFQPTTERCFYGKSTKTVV